MLQLNRKADYALRLMLELGANDQRTLTTAEVARRQDIPYEFLRKIAQPLISSGLLTSERGVRGGLSLARPAEHISVLDIVRAFGPPYLNRCTAEPPRCDRRNNCAGYAVWAEAQNEVDRVLAGSHLSDLVERQAALDRRGKNGPAATKGERSAPGHVDGGVESPSG